MPQAQPGNIVQVSYTGRLEDGTIFDASTQDAPFEFKLGAGHTISGFEQAVVGRQVGEDKTMCIPAEQAYGIHRPEMVLTMPLQNLPKHIQPEVGQQLQIQREGESAIGVIVVGVTDIHVLLNANHPLAGQDLTFDISLPLSLRDHRTSESCYLGETSEGWHFHIMWHESTTRVRSTPR